MRPEIVNLRRNIKKIVRRPARSAVREALCIPSGQISLEEGRLLSTLLQQVDPTRPIVEIGTLFGWSTRIMVLAKPASMELITVDGYYWNPLGLSAETHLAITTEILEESTRLFNVKQVNANKTDFYRTYSGKPPALIFLDADHEYEGTREDLEWATQFKDAFICLHDYRKEWPGVIKAVDELGGPDQMAGTLCVLKKGASYPASGK